MQQRGWAGDFKLQDLKEMVVCYTFRPDCSSGNIQLLYTTQLHLRASAQRYCVKVLLTENLDSMFQKGPTLLVVQSDISPEDSQMRDWIITAAKSRKFLVVREGGVNGMSDITSVNSMLHTQTSSIFAAMQVMPILKQR